jgi:hypothetical protein
LISRLDDCDRSNLGNHYVSRISRRNGTWRLGAVGVVLGRFVGGRRQHHDVGVAERSDLPACLDPVDPRQHQIEEIDRIVGLSTGADDYVTAGERPPACERRFADLEIDPEAREVRRGGEPVELTKLEFDLLDVLSGEPRVAFSRERLLERVWGSEWFGDDHVVDVHIANLRAKLGDDPRAPRYLRTIRGVGYRMGDGQ